MDNNEICVLIPTYNNAKTIVQVITDVRQYVSDIIVVNDGCTDGTHELLMAVEGITVLSYGENRGKGYALRHGLREADAMGYRYAISIDSDGQHYASDIPAFISKIEESPDSLLIGARNLKQDNMPSKNTFANRFSNFWYMVETGKKLDDTQSGYRLYPLQKMRGMRYVSRRYEFEVESIVRACWRGINVQNIPISVYYPPEGERISHFRPFADFFRISVLNTILVLLAYLWFLPVMFIRALSVKKVKTFFREKIVKSADSNRKITYATMLGVFMGIVPIWGYQMLTAFFLARILKLNRYITLLASNISIAPILPFVLLGSYATGGWVLGRGFNLSITNISLQTVTHDLLQYILGSFIFAAACALVAGGLCYVLLAIFRKNNGKNNVHSNTAI